MSEFLKILAIYYMCDSTAATRPLTPEEVMGCQRTYETVKSYFSGLDTQTNPTPVQIATRNRNAYTRFKSWERENADLVADMRAEIRARIES